MVSNRQQKDIPQDELHRLLAYFFVTIKQDCTLYEPDTDIFSEKHQQTFHAQSATTL